MDEIKKLVKKYLPKRKKFIPGVSPITISSGHLQLGAEEMEALVHSCLEFRIVDGEVSRLFEKEMSKFLGIRHSVFCNSGSSANLLAVMSLTSPKLGSRALRVGDEIITSAVGFPTTVAPILQAGCVPVFVDVSTVTYNPTPFQIEAAITEKTKAIFLAHTLGNPFDVEAIRDIADRNGLWLIEDCCDALGGEFGGNKLGTFGSISTTSFYPAHLMVTGEGGMVFTDSPILNQIIRSFRDWGRDCWCAVNKDNTCGKRFDQKGKGDLPDGFDHKYIYSHVGFNLKSTDLQASLGLEQLKKLPKFIEARSHNWQVICDGLAKGGADRYFILPNFYPRSSPAWFGFLLTIKPGSPFTRNEIIKHLESKNIATRNLFGGNITKQPAFKEKGRAFDVLPKADLVMSNTFWIGVHPALTDEMCNYMVSTILEFIDSRKLE